MLWKFQNNINLATNPNNVWNLKHIYHCTARLHIQILSEPLRDPKRWQPIYWFAKPQWYYRVQICFCAPYVYTIVLHPKSTYSINSSAITLSFLLLPLDWITMKTSREKKLKQWQRKFNMENLSLKSRGKTKKFQ